MKLGAKKKLKTALPKALGCALLLCLLFTSGCTTTNYYSAGLDFTILDNPEGRWQLTSCEPNTSKNHISVHYRSPLGKDTSIDLLISFYGTYYTWESHYADLITAPLTFISIANNAESCKKYSKQVTEIFFIGDNLEFDTARVYVLKDEQQFFDVYATSPRWGAKRYNLTDPNVKKKHSPFSFKFPLSCADYENAVFVIDGLYQNGKKLPTLKIKLKYKNFDQVPQNTLLSN